MTCFRDGTVTLRKNRRLRGYTEATVEHGYQGIRKGDLVIHGMDAFAGAIGVSDSDGKGTPVYNVCQPGAAQMLGTTPISSERCRNRLANADKMRIPASAVALKLATGAARPR